MPRYTHSKIGRQIKARMKELNLSIPDMGDALGVNGSTVMNSLSIDRLKRMRLSHLREIAAAVKMRVVVKLEPEK